MPPLTLPIGHGEDDWNLAPLSPADGKDVDPNRTASPLSPVVPLHPSDQLDSPQLLAETIAPFSGDSPLDSSNKGWVSITKRKGLGKTGRPSCEINWNGDSPTKSSPDSLSIPTPNQENRTIIEEEPAGGFLGCTDFTDQNAVSTDIYEKARESASSEWLRTKTWNAGRQWAYMWVTMTAIGNH